MSKETEDELLIYQSALHNRKIPLLSLDVRWYELFSDYEKSPRMKELEKELNELVKKQGKLSTDNKEMKKLKKRLMQEIVNNMEGTEQASSLKGRKLEASQKLIGDINGKMEEADKELLQLPYEIQRVNEELMAESLRVCYGRLDENAGQMKELREEIKEIQQKLTEKILEQQDKELKNEKIYSYMNSLVGPEVLNILDRRNGYVKAGSIKSEYPSLAVPGGGGYSKTTAASEKKGKKNGIFKRLKKTAEQPVEEEDLEKDLPVGTGNRVVQKRMGFHRNEQDQTGKKASDYYYLQGKKGKTRVQEEEEDRRKREKFLKELQAYDREQEIKERKRNAQQEELEIQENFLEGKKEDGYQTVTETMKPSFRPSPEERRKNRKKRRTSLK